NNQTIEIEQLKKELKLKNERLYQIDGNDNEEKKENNFNMSNFNLFSSSGLVDITVEDALQKIELILISMKKLNGTKRKLLLVVAHMNYLYKLSVIIEGFWKYDLNNVFAYKDLLWSLNNNLFGESETYEPFIVFDYKPPNALEAFNNEIGVLQAI
ncbi:hypothetical protein RFI_39139, partial [Reticulomyxa filosa]